MGGNEGVATTRSCLGQDYPAIDWLVIAYRGVALARMRHQVKAVRAANFMRQPGGARGRDVAAGIFTFPSLWGRIAAPSQRLVQPACPVWLASSESARHRHNTLSHRQKFATCPHQYLHDSNTAII